MAEHRRTCTSCGTANEVDARFCEGCGAELARACCACGVEANASARFCRACGAPLGDRVGPALDITDAGPSRKTVTVMFADLAGSTSFEEQVDAETAREVMSRYHAVLRSTADRHRVGVTKYIGDGFMAVWGVPEMGPDDASRAVDAAAELQERFVDFASRVSRSHGVELALRVAVNTGEVVVGAGDADLVGDALNVAARLEAECPRGHVVVGGETWRSTRGRYGYESLGQVQVKGRTAPVAVYRWLGHRSETTDSAPIVGRADEVRRLAATLDDAIAIRAARLITVIGDPGVGKSRLAAEFAASQGDARVVDARCDVKGAAALAPIVELVRARDLETDLPATVPERDRILRDLDGLATGVPGSVEEVFWALRRYVEVLASDKPLIVIVDDVQWADALVLDFIEHLVEWVKDVPVLLLALARPELRELRPDLVTVSRWVTEVVHLGGLDSDATAELAARVLGGGQLPEDLLRRLPASTGGNPLFVRELVGMLVYDEVLVAEPAGWRLTIDVDAIAIPPTIQALLASRLERLNPIDRRVLEIASVVGTDFSLDAVEALAEHVGAQVTSSLDRLRRLELAQPGGAYLGDQPVWRFHHVLIRDVAYRRLLKSDRANLHERLADWVEAREGAGAFDSDEMIARHLETACGYRRELGILDDHTDALALRSARRYLTSARRALDRDELVSAGTQAARGAALAAGDELVHADLLLVGCEAFLSAGDVAAGAPLVDDLDEIAVGALAPWATCYRCQLIVYTDPDRLPEVDVRLQGAIDDFGHRNDPAGLAKAHRVRASTRSRLGRVGDAEVDLFEALIAARKVGDHRQITAALGAAPSAALWGPSPVPKAGGRCLDVVRMQRMTTAAPSLEATSLRCLAVLELLRGRPDKARAMLADARHVVADLGLRHGLMETELFAGMIESMVGDQVAAEPHFRTALEGLDALGVGADAGQAAALLARSVLAQGRVEEADRYAAESERIAGHNLKTAIAWRAVRAEILAAQGVLDEAVAMAKEAVVVAAGTDLVLDHAEACSALSRVLASAGDEPGATRARCDAETLYAAKEAVTTTGQTVNPVAPVESPQALEISRLAIQNRASMATEASWLAMRAHDIDSLVAGYADRFVYDDRRRLRFKPVTDRAGIRAAFERVCEQFTAFEGRALAVRGERLVLTRIRWSDDAGNQTTGFFVFEGDDHGRTIYAGRFDDEDFDGAYRELEHRFYTGEGAAYAASGTTMTEVVTAHNEGDLDRAFGELTAPDFRIENRSRSAFPDRSAAELRASTEELQDMFASVRVCYSAVRWMTPDLVVARQDRQAVGPDGEEYQWIQLYVTEFEDGLVASVCSFDVEDEDAAFAYAEERMRATISRLALTNRAGDVAISVARAYQDRDVETAVAAYADEFTYDDRRRLRGDPVSARGALRATCERICQQFSVFEVRTLAVRGERLHLAWDFWSDDAGSETAHLNLVEVGDDGRIHYCGLFDEDDFEGAYRELEGRYYAGEGAAFAGGGGPSVEWVTALNRGDFDRAFVEMTTPDAPFENRSRVAFPDPSVSDAMASYRGLNAMVSSVRTWASAVCWVSRVWGVARLDREAVGRDGETYTWTWLNVCAVRNGQFLSSCLFDPEDEKAAFAYAEERVRATSGRLAVTNRSCGTSDAILRALQAHDVDGVVACCSDRLRYDDRRRLSGGPIHGAVQLRAAFERIIHQYDDFTGRVLAVRGDRLNLHWTRWSDGAGNQTAYLHVSEIGDDGRLDYEGRFDEDDFEGAYRELERRYYTGEGAAFANSGVVTVEWLTALNRNDFDTVFGALTMADLAVEDRSRSVLGNRSAMVFRDALEGLAAMVKSTRAWTSAIHWATPASAVIRFEREAIGLDGEGFAWSWIFVVVFRDGKLARLHQFEPDDEEAAVVYAEALARQ